MQVIEHHKWTLGVHGSLAWAFDGDLLILADISRVRRSAPRLKQSDLTEPELACLRLATLSNAEVTRRLSINAYSTKRYFDCLRMKLGATSRGEAMVIGLRRGLVSVSDLPVTSCDPPLVVLSSREAAYARLAALSVKAAAVRMSASESVVKFHFANLARKLGTHSRAEAILAMIRRGYMTLDDVVTSGNPAAVARG